MSYLTEFKPQPETVQQHEMLAQLLGELDRKIKTSNNIPTKALAEQHLLPIFLAFHQWSVAQTSDVIAYAQAVAEMVGEGGLDEEVADLLAEIHEFLEGLDRLFAAGFSGSAALPEKLSAARTRAKELADQIADVLTDEVGEDEVSESPLFDDDTPTPSELPSASPAAGDAEGGAA